MVKLWPTDTIFIVWAALKMMFVFCDSHEIRPNQFAMDEIWKFHVTKNAFISDCECRVYFVGAKFQNTFFLLLFLINFVLIESMICEKWISYFTKEKKKRISSYFSMTKSLASSCGTAWTAIMHAEQSFQSEWINLVVRKWAIVSHTAYTKHKHK